MGDGLFGNTKKLTKIIVSPKNPRYCCIDEKFIYGKSNIEQLNYDILIFGVRNIESITNPIFVKKKYVHQHFLIVRIFIKLKFRLIQNFKQLKMMHLLIHKSNTSEYLLKSQK